MPLQPPHAEQARWSSSSAFTGDGAPLRAGSAFRPADARRMFTPHRATSNCVRFPVAKIDARARRTEGASARSEGNGTTVAAASGIDLTRRCDSAKSGRRPVNELALVNPSQRCNASKAACTSTGARSALSITDTVCGSYILAPPSDRRFATDATAKVSPRLGQSNLCDTESHARLYFAAPLQVAA
jgi:hypothetical protein